MSSKSPALLCLWALTCGTAAGQDAAVPGLAIARAQPGVPLGTLVADLESRLPGVTFSLEDDALASRDIYLLRFEPPELGDAVELMLDTLENDPANETSLWGERLYEGFDPEGRTGSVWFHSVSGEALFADQYAATMLGLPQAHERATGQGVVVAVLDTGLDGGHPLLADRIAPGGWSFLTGGPDTSDPNGHGTFVAGLIHLAAPDAKLLPVVVLGPDGRGDAWSFAQGLFHAIDRGVEVINLSLGSTYKSDAVGAALAEATSLGIVVIAAGGNRNVDEEGEEYPAAQSGGLGIAAVDDLDVKAEFSNYNEAFFLSAPGTSAPMEGAPDGFDPTRTIYSALPGAEYGIWQGTSFSTALVSGAAALVRSQHPEWAPVEATAESVATALALTSVDISAGNPGYPGQLGAGRLDAGTATLLGPPAPAIGDLNNDGVVGILDFLTLLEAWGLTHSSADLDGDGVVGITDMLILLANWG